MNFFEVECMGLIFILFPLYVYLFYAAYHIDMGKEDNNLFLDFAILSSFYLSIRFTSLLENQEVIFLMNTVLMLAYIKKRLHISILLSLFCICYYKMSFDFPIPFLTIQYLILFLLYILYRNAKIKKIVFCYLFVFIETCSIFFLLYLSVYTPYILGQQSIIHTLLTILIFCFGSLTSFLLFESAESIVRYQSNIKKLKEESKLRNSLFRITHEIKNPIAVCKGYLDMFDIHKKECSEKYIPIIRKEIDSTLLLLEDFLSMNKIKIEKEELDISLLLEDIVSHFSLLLKENKIQGIFKIPDDEIYIYGDYNRLMQVLINLVKNSIEALENRENPIIHLYTDRKENDFYIIIEDNGIGIPLDELEKIKEPFYTTKRRGTGLGVSLSEEIIEAHHGTLTYHSLYLEGTKVEIKIPIK